MTFALPLAELRAISNEFLPDSCVIQRAVEVSSGDGQSSTWATLATVACRVSRVGHGGAEALGVADQIQAIGQRRITLPAGTDITTKDRLVIGSRTYEIADVPVISNEVVRAIVAREVT